ncbi:hypothetical protein D3C87_2054710 [compost metagenome]
MGWSLRQHQFKVVDGFFVLTASVLGIAKPKPCRGCKATARILFDERTKGGASF